MGTAVRISRRQALGLAAGGAAGAAGLRLLTLTLGGATPPAGAAGRVVAGPGGAWRSPLDQPRALAAHLLRRAGFAAGAGQLDAAASMRYADLVDAVVGQQPDPLPRPPDVTASTAVVQAWYRHMATTAAQFPERMTLFWHGLLTSDFRKANRLPFVYGQNQALRTHALDDLRTLLLTVTYDPLMIRYLDLDQSSAGAPNENYARELMELFTLGVGNFSEDDVRQGARALSGIRIRLVDPQGRPVPLPRPDRQAAGGVQAYEAQLQQLVAQGYTFRGWLNPRLHDGGAKSFLGRTGDLGPEEVVDSILSKDACATHIATRALLFFSSPQPSDAEVARVAAAFRGSGYDIRTLMRAIFLGDEFTSAAAYRSLVRSPADYMVATMRVLGQPELSAAAPTAGRAMDQVLYDPPTVAGWPVNAGWISSSAMLARLNFAQVVVNRGGSLPDPVEAVRTHLDGVVGDDTARVFDASTTAADRWYALLGSPEFQLK